MRGALASLLTGAMLFLAGIACNLSPSETSTNTTPTLPAPENAGRPSIVILEPANGTQVVVKQQVLIKVRAVDSIGITWVKLQRDGKVIVLQPSPDSVTTFEAILPFTPPDLGDYTLQVVAHRGDVASDPVQIMLQVVGANNLGNPVTTSCTARVTVNNLNLRQGASTGFQVLTKLGLGEQLAVTGRNADSTWWQVRRADGTTGWVSAQYTSLEGDCSSISVVL